MKESKGSKCFCKGCLTDVDPRDMSPDERYCMICFIFLLKEKEVHPDHKGSWIPKGGIDLPQQMPLLDG